MGVIPGSASAGGRQQAAQPAAPFPIVRRPSRATIQAVADSCRAVAERPVRLAEVFYAHLFDMAPAARAMFPADMSHQMQKMTDTLLTAIQHLASADTVELEATLRRLGTLHREKYGVLPEHYLYIAHALTRAVRDVAGASYSGTLSSAWIAVTQWVCGLMLAEEPEPAADSRPPEPAQPAPDQYFQPAPPRLPPPRAPGHDMRPAVRGPESHVPSWYSPR